MGPDFLGIGVPRGGSSWLHELIGAHPDVFASRHKETRFFDQNFANGWSWYARHFPPDHERGRWRAVGESTPFYLFDPEALARIRRVPSIRRFLVILRDPVDRLLSHHAWLVQHRGAGTDLDRFLRDVPDAIRWSRYAESLARWMDAFGPERLLVLEYAEATADPVRTRERVARHLDLDPARFPAEAGLRPVNESFSPRFPAAFRVASRAAAGLRRRRLGGVSRFAVRRLGARRWFGRRPVAPRQLDAARRAALFRRFEDDVDRLEDLLGRRFDAWRPAAREGSRPDS